MQHVDTQMLARITVAHPDMCVSAVSVVSAEKRSLPLLADSTTNPETFTQQQAYVILLALSPTKPHLMPRRCMQFNRHV